MGDGKRFMSYEIVKRLAASSETAILQQLQDGVNSSDKKRGKLHEVWEDSFDWKECRSYDFVNQKLHYMPVRTALAGRAQQSLQWKMESGC